MGDAWNGSRVADDATVSNSLLGKKCRIWSRACLIDSHVGDGASVGDDACVLRSRLESHVSINRRNFVNDSSVGSMTYTGVGTSVHKADIGKFCSIASGVELGGADHDYTAVSTYTKERLNSALGGGYEEKNAFEAYTCKIGNDVWIGANATIVGKASVGDGAVVGAGAVVVGDIPPYAIAVGVPARVLRFRFDEETIGRLLGIAWWSWPLEFLLEHQDLITGKPTSASLAEMERLSLSFGGVRFDERLDLASEARHGKE